MERQEQFIKEFKLKANQVASTLGVCLQEQFKVIEEQGDKAIVVDETGAYI
jgi:hypothetical protein